MLKTERYTKTMGRRVKAAARKILRRRHLFNFFEHGHWWITDVRSGAEYSVVDAEGGNSVDGFDLEMVTEPQEF